MKKFSTEISGYVVTNENYVAVAKEISTKYGVCPALDLLIMQCVANDETVECSKKGLKAAFHKYIVIIGYKPAYFYSQLRSIGTEY